MPKYLAPGVYVEERSSQPKPIEGVPTSTTGFIGPCHDGPIKRTILVTPPRRLRADVWGAPQATARWRFEASIDKGTQWAVFEPNGEPLWANIRRAVQDFLTNEWRSGGLPGSKAEEAFFVKGDRSTMTQADIDQGG